MNNSLHSNNSYAVNLNGLASQQLSVSTDFNISTETFTNNVHSLLSGPDNEVKLTDAAEASSLGSQPSTSTLESLLEAVASDEEDFLIENISNALNLQARSSFLRVYKNINRARRLMNTVGEFLPASTITNYSMSIATFIYWLTNTSS